MDPSIVIGALGFLGGGGVALYLAKPRRDAIAVSSSETAMRIVMESIERLEADLAKATKRIATLELALEKTGEEAKDALAAATLAAADALEVTAEAKAQALNVVAEAKAEALRASEEAHVTCEQRIQALRAIVDELTAKLNQAPDAG